MAKSKQKFYAVAKGAKPGIYTTWGEVQPLVQGYEGAKHKSFATRSEAEEWIRNPVYQQSGKSASKTSKAKQERNAVKPEIKEGTVTIFTDGSSIGNPGPGGYGVVQIVGINRKELSGGFNLTTNNRMELMACLVALRELEPEYCNKKIILYTDSQYVVNGIMKGWAKKWRDNNWIKPSDKKPAINPDLWSELLKLFEGRGEIVFKWIKGHAGHKENERCDVLANDAARMRDGLMPEDAGYRPESV